MQISDTVIIGCVGSLVGTVCYLAKLIHNNNKAQIEGMKNTIIQHGKDAAVMRANSEAMQEEIDRLSKGCGAISCHWLHKDRLPINNKPE